VLILREPGRGLHGMRDLVFDELGRLRSIGYSDIAVGPIRVTPTRNDVRIVF
jgi:hypothetical protein